MSDTVKVSDRMQALVGSLRDMSCRFDANIANYAETEAALLREIATLEAKADLNSDPSYLTKPTDALISLPQTPGEAIPDWVRQRVIDADDLYAANPELHDRSALHAIKLLGAERSRLLAALDEKEQQIILLVSEWRTAHAKLATELQKVVAERDALQSAVVLQKEALQSKIDRLRAAGNQLSNCAFNLAQPEVTMTDDRRATLKRCQEDWDNARIA